MHDALNNLIHTHKLWPAQTTHAAHYTATNISRPQSPHTDPTHVVPFGIASIDNNLPGQGLPRSVHELITDSRHARHMQAPHALLSFLAVQSLYSTIAPRPYVSTGKYILWIGKDCWPAPFLIHTLFSASLSQEALLNQCIFIHTQTHKELLWTIDSALNSGAVAGIIAAIPTLSFSQSQRFLLRAQKNSIFTIFVRNQQALNTPSAALSRWRCIPTHTHRPYPCWELSLLHYKGPQPLQRRWHIELCESANSFSLQEVDSSANASTQTKLADELNATDTDRVQRASR